MDASTTSRGTKLIVTYHPAYLLRDPRQKKEAWADLQLAMAELGLKAPAKGQKRSSLLTTEIALCSLDPATPTRYRPPHHGNVSPRWM